MKGSVLNGFENFVVDQYGLDKWQAIIDGGASTTEGIYLIPELYADTEIVSLITSLSEKINKDGSSIQREFGQYLFPVLFSSISTLVQEITDLFDFLITVDKVIHVEVQKSDPQAYMPTLYFDSPNKQTLIVRYISSRKMCYMAEGLILGAAKHYNTPVQISQNCCLNQGDKYCIIKVSK